MVKKSGIYHHNLFVRGNMVSIARIRPTPLKKKKKSTLPPLQRIRSISFEREKPSNNSYNPEMCKSSSRNHDDDQQHGHDYDYDPPEYNHFDSGYCDAASSDTSIVTEDGEFDLFDLLELGEIEDCECKCNGNGKCFLSKL